MAKILIIEDESLIQEELIFLLDKKEGVEVVGTAKSIKDSVLKLQLLSPDLVLMDVQLEDGLSFNIFEQIKEYSFGVIFITAFDTYALKAIKVSAFDYLLKPINELEFNTSIDKFLSQKKRYHFSKKQSDYLSENYHQINVSKKIIIKTTTKTHFLHQKDVVVCKGDGNYTTFYLKNKTKVISSKPLKYYREIVNEKLFIHPHQSFLVNKEFIESITSNNQLVLSIDMFQIPISLRRKKEVVHKINNEGIL